MRGKRIINRIKARRLRKKKKFQTMAASSFNSWIEKMSYADHSGDIKSDSFPSIDKGRGTSLEKQELIQMIIDKDTILRKGTENEKPTGYSALIILSLEELQEYYDTIKDKKNPLYE